jgi:hypothetical protein
MTQNTPQWEEEFGEKFATSATGGVLPQHRDGGHILKEELKAFIRTQIEAAEQRGWNDAVEYIRSNAMADTFISGTAPKEFGGDTYYIIRGSSLETARAPEEEDTSV